MRFWDTSAIVPLAVSQTPHTLQAERWVAEDSQVAVWTLTIVEATAAVQRLVREGMLDEAAAAAAEAVVERVITHCHVVTAVDEVKALARRLLRVHPLRAADALQLGAALVWAGGTPAGFVVHSFDAHLTAAARREGFRLQS